MSRLLLYRPGPVVEISGFSSGNYVLHFGGRSFSARVYDMENVFDSGEPVKRVAYFDPAARQTVGEAYGVSFDDYLDLFLSENPTSRLAFQV